MEIKLTTMAKTYIWIVAAVVTILTAVSLLLILEDAGVTNTVIYSLLVPLALSLSLFAGIWCAGATSQAIADMVIQERLSRMHPPAPVKEGEIVPVYRSGELVPGRWLIRVGGTTVLVERVKVGQQLDEEE